MPTKQSLTRAASAWPSARSARTGARSVGWRSGARSTARDAVRPARCPSTVFVQATLPGLSSAPRPLVAYALSAPLGTSFNKAGAIKQQGSPGRVCAQRRVVESVRHVPMAYRFPALLERVVYATRRVQNAQPLTARLLVLRASPGTISTAQLASV